MSTIIYTPSTSAVSFSSDHQAASAQSMLQALFDAASTHHNGQAQLQQLAEGAGELFILGHLCLPNKIAINGEHLSVGELVAQLRAEGLPNAPHRAITLHIYACCTTQRLHYHGNLQESFVIAFCKELVKQGCRNYKVVSYLGKRAVQGLFAETAQQTAVGNVEYVVESECFRKVNGSEQQGFVAHHWHKAVADPMHVN